MSVCWRCPHCESETCQTDYIDPRQPVVCGGCGAALCRDEVLCTVCHGRNALMRRDSLHYWCLECGHTQTPWSMSA